MTEAGSGPEPSKQTASDPSVLATDAILARFAESFEASARRWELIVYPSLFGFIVLAGYGFFLVYSLTKDMHTLASNVDPAMAQNMVVIADNIAELSDNVQTMDKNLEQMLARMESIDGNLDLMQSNLAQVSTDMRTVSQTMIQVTTQLTVLEPMRLEMHAMNVNMSRMSVDMNKFTRPESFLPFFR